MKSVRVIVAVPEQLKRKLDALRKQGITTAGYIRSLLERELASKKNAA